MEKQTTTQPTAEAQNPLVKTLDRLNAHLDRFENAKEQTETPAKAPLFTDDEIVGIAAVCHEANAAYCSTLGDRSQVTWGLAPDWQRESAIAGVKKHLERDLNPRQSHESWLSQKLRDGWTYGPVKDPRTKQHPCMLPYDELPESEKLKDHIFGAIVHAFRQARVNARMQARLAGAKEEGGSSSY